MDRSGSRACRRAARAGLAAIVLVVFGGTLLAACGSDSDGSIGSSADTYLLPPEGAEVVRASGSYGNGTDPDPDPAQLNGYLITWSDPSGTDVMLDVARSGSTRVVPTPSTIDFAAPRDLEELFDVVDRVFGRSPFDRSAFEPMDGGPLEPAATYCTRMMDAAQLIVVGTAGRSLAVLTGGETTGCDELRRDSALLRASRELRVVDEAEWRAFMADHGTLEAATTTTASTTTTLDPALAPYCDAVERFTSSGVTDPDSGAIGPEGVPYLEDVRDVAPPELRSSYDAFISWVAAGSPQPAPEEVGPAGLAMTRDYLDTCQGTVR